MDLLKIAESWIIAANPTKEEEEKANLRLSECNKCEKLKYQNILKFHFCESCGCPINKKIFDPTINPCPLQKWIWEEK